MMDFKTMCQDRIKLLKQTQLFYNFTERQLQKLAEILHEVHLQEGRIIFSKGEVGDNLYIIDTGRVKISLIHPNGNELIINIYAGGDVFGELSLFDNLPRSATATALTEVAALTMSRYDYEALMENVQGFGTSVVHILSRRLRYTTTQLELVTLLNAYERVSLKLKQMVDATSPNPTGEPVILNITQQELGEMVSLSRVWINRVLKYWEEEGLLQTKRGQIIILHLEQL